MSYFLELVFYFISFLTALKQQFSANTLVIINDSNSTLLIVPTIMYSLKVYACNYTKYTDQN